MILCVMTALCGCGQTNSTPEFDKSVSMTASEVAEPMGIGLNIGNTMEAYESSHHTNGFQSAVITPPRTMKPAGEQL